MPSGLAKCKNEGMPNDSNSTPGVLLSLDGRTALVTRSEERRVGK